MLQKTKYVEDRESWGHEYGSILKQLNRIQCNLTLVNKIIKLDGKPLRILDIGCAYGYYLQMLKLLNPDHECYGVEVAEDAVNYSRKMLGYDNIFWQSGSERVPLPDESLDLILLFDCIEHIPDIQNIECTFKECPRLLKNDGYLFVRTPANNLQTKICATIIRQGDKLAGKDHPSLFTEKKLIKLIEKSYFNINQIVYNNYLFPNTFSKIFNKSKVGVMFFVISKNVMFVRMNPKNTDCNR